MIPHVEVTGFRIFGLYLHPFGILVTIGVIAGFLMAVREARLRGLDVTVIERGCVYAVAAGFLGAGIGDAIFYRPAEFFADPLGAIDFRTHMSSLSGILTATMVGVLYLMWRGAPVVAGTSVVFTGLAFGWFFGRMGCALVHDHPGALTDFPLGVGFPGGARHDLGLYEFLFTAVLCAVLLAIDRMKRTPGQMLALIVLPYLAVRFGLDFLRVSDALYLGLTPAQWMCLAILAPVLVHLAVKRWRPLP